MADGVLFQPQVARASPLVDHRRGHGADAHRADALKLDRGRLHVLEPLLGIVLTQVCRRRVVVDQGDVKTAAAEVVLYDPHVIAERVVVGLPGLAGGVGDVCDDARGRRDRARDLRYEKARAYRRVETAWSERDEIRGGDGFDAARRRGYVLARLQEDALDARLTHGAYLHLLFADRP